VNVTAQVYAPLSEDAQLDAVGAAFAEALDASETLGEPLGEQLPQS
jgi:hypothetical protein